MRYNKIIFVSLESTFTSPVAEVIMKKKLEDAGIDMQVESRGVVVLFREPANPKGVTIAKSKGLDMQEYMSEQLEDKDFADDVLVLVMTEKLKFEVYEKFKAALNVYNIREFVGGTGDIETPYGKGLQEYGEAFNMIEKLIDKVILKLKELEEV